jgi:hypothetical protein
VLSLWKEPIPPGWLRGRDPRISDRHRRYCRGNSSPQAHRPAEHAIEYDVLTPSPTETPTHCLGARLIDGVNAVPLTRDAGGRRRANIEADMLLLLRAAEGHRLVLAEVKVGSNNAWYAVVENLRQLRLFKESVVTQRLFHIRRADLNLRHPLPVTSIVLAPPAFYTASGKRSAAVGPARELIRRARAAEIDVLLTTWDSDRRTIELLP